MEMEKSEIFCKRVNSAIKISSGYATKENPTLAYLARILPSVKGKESGKWARISLSTKVTKELKKLKNNFLKYYLKVLDEVATKVDDDQMTVDCIEFAIKFKQLTREALASKVNAPVEERVEWEELIENLDLVGFQISEISEYFSTLGRYNYGKKKKKNQQREAVNNVNLNNFMKQKEKAPSKKVPSQNIIETEMGK